MRAESRSSRCSTLLSGGVERQVANLILQQEGELGYYACFESPVDTPAKSNYQALCMKTGCVRVAKVFKKDQLQRAYDQYVAIYGVSNVSTTEDTISEYA